MRPFRKELDCVHHTSLLYGTHDHRPHPATCTVVHTTGSGPHRRSKTRGTPPFETALWLYETGRTSGFGPHFVVGQAPGEIAQLAPIDFSVPHVGASHRATYHSKELQAHRRMRWWFKRWLGLSTPLELASGLLWQGGSVNDNTVGIEVVPPSASPREPWTRDAWVNLVVLLNELRDKYQIPISPQTTVTHSDANPLARTTRLGRPWDPSPQQWPGFDTLEQWL